MKFEEGPLHAVSDQPVGDLLEETLEEGFDAHSRTLYDDDEQVFGSDSEVYEQVMLVPDPLPVWAKNTLHDVNKLVGNSADPRRTRSQFFEAPTDLDAKN